MIKLKKIHPLFKFEFKIRIINMLKMNRIHNNKKNRTLLKFRKFLIDLQCKKKEEASFKKLT